MFLSSIFLGMETYSQVVFNTGYTAKFYTKGQEPVEISNLNGCGLNVHTKKTYFDATWRGSSVKLDWKNVSSIQFYGNPRELGGCPRGAGLTNFKRYAVVTLKNGKKDSLIIGIDHWCGSSLFGDWEYDSYNGHPEIKNYRCERDFTNIEELEKIEFIKWGN